MFWADSSRLPHSALTLRCIYPLKRLSLCKIITPLGLYIQENVPSVVRNRTYVTLQSNFSSAQDPIVKPRCPSWCAERNVNLFYSRKLKKIWWTHPPTSHPYHPDLPVPDSVQQKNDFHRYYVTTSHFIALVTHVVFRRPKCWNRLAH